MVPLGFLKSVSFLRMCLLCRPEWQNKGIVRQALVCCLLPWCCTSHSMTVCCCPIIHLRYILKDSFLLCFPDCCKSSVFLFLTSDDAELLWRLARSSRDLAQLGSTSAEEKKQLTYDSLEYAKKALEKNESNFAAHKVSRTK